MNDARTKADEPAIYTARVRDVYRGEMIGEQLIISMTREQARDVIIDLVDTLAGEGSGGALLSLAADVRLATKEQP